MRGHCGLVDPANPCRCSRRVGTALATGRVDPGNLLFVRHVDAHVARIERMRDAAAVFHSHPELRAPDRVVAAVTAALRG
jgi:hypothetical protein